MLTVTITDNNIQLCLFVSCLYASIAGYNLTFLAGTYYYYWYFVLFAIILGGYLLISNYTYYYHYLFIYLQPFCTMPTM